MNDVAQAVLQVLPKLNNFPAVDFGRPAHVGAGFQTVGSKAGASFVGPTGAFAGSVLRP
jgi:hypothetical protein